MKKTLIFALAAMSAMAADPILDLTTDNVQVNEYSLEGITDHHYTVVFTLDLVKMMSSAGQSPIVGLGGSLTTGNYLAEMLAFNNGTITYSVQQKGDSSAAFTFPTSGYENKWKTVSSLTGYDSLANTTPDWNSSSASSAVFVLVGERATRDKFTGYLYIQTDDGLNCYAGTKDWSFKASIDTLKIYEASGDPDFSYTTIDSLQVYAESMNEAQAKELASAILATSTPGTDTTVPEPATATLSLLALAGLAARRRRK